MSRAKQTKRLMALIDSYNRDRGLADCAPNKRLEPLPVTASNTQIKNAARAIRAESGLRRKSLNGWTFIYALVDPRDGAYRYIGKSNTPRKRLRQHIEDLDKCNFLKTAWLRELAALKLEPGLQVLEKCRIEDWKERERAWIKSTKQSGIVNLTEGGDQSAS